MTQKLNLKTLDHFMTWLDRKLEKRGWSDYQLTKTAKISHSIMSKARSGTQAIGWDACVKIAEALELPPETVLREAGLLPKRPEHDPELDEMAHLFLQLPPERREEFIKMIRAVLPDKE